MSKKEKFNCILRICFVQIPNELGKDLCLVEGALIILQKINKKFAYGYHIKKQGGKTIGEYHLILKANMFDSNNDVSIEDNEIAQKQLCSCGSGEMVKDCCATLVWETFIGDFSFDENTAEHISGFDLKEANNVFIELDKLVTENLHLGMNLEEKLHSFYDDKYLCYKSRFKNLEEHNGTFWYSKDIIVPEENIFTRIDVEYVSEVVPGNMVFIS